VKKVFNFLILYSIIILFLIKNI